MAEFIQKTDTLNEGREKLNEAIKDSETAKVTAKGAEGVAGQAKQIAQTAEGKADDTQHQLDTIIIESGTSDAEVIQARGDEPLLKDRLNKNDRQLADAVSDVRQRELNILTYSNLVIESEGIRDWSAAVSQAIKDLPTGGKLVFPSRDYIFEGVIVNKTVHIDLRESSITSISPDTSIIKVEGTRNEENYILSTPLKRGDTRISLTTLELNVTEGDFVIIKDDQTRITDNKKDMNVELHEVAFVDKSLGVIYIKDYIRLPKKVSNTVNVYKVNPVNNVVIEGGSYSQVEGSFTGSPIEAEYTTGLRISKIKTTRTLGPSVHIKASYDVVISDFRFEYPQATGGGQGYGIALFGGVHNFSIRDGLGVGMRHSIDIHSSFDGILENIISQKGRGADFVLSHNGWSSDISVFNCRVYNGNGSSVVVSAQGVADKYGLVHFGIKVKDCLFQIDNETTNDIKGISIETPTRGCVLENVTIIYGNGETTSANNHEAIRLPVVDSDIYINNVTLEAFYWGIRMDDGTDPTQISAAEIVISKLKTYKVYSVISNSYGRNKRMVIKNVKVEGTEGSIVRVPQGSFAKLTIDNVESVNSINSTLFPTFPTRSNGLINGIIRGYLKEGVIGGLTVTNSKILTLEEFFSHSNNDILSLSSATAVTLGGFPIPEGIVEYQKVTILNIGQNTITVPSSTKLVSVSGSYIELSPKMSVSLTWRNGAWREIK